MIQYMVREVQTFALIAADLALGFLTWLMIAGLVPGDSVGFNVVGSLVLFGVCVLPWWLLDRYVQHRIARS